MRRWKLKQALYIGRLAKAASRAAPPKGLAWKERLIP